MLARIRSRFRRAERSPTLDQHWALNHQVADLYRRIAEVQATVVTEIAAAAEGYLTDLRRRHEATEAAIEQALLTARTHAEAASAAATETAIAASREHAEAATAAALEQAIAAAREHAEALSEQMRAEVTAELAVLRRRMEVARRAAEAPPATAPTATATATATVLQPTVDPGFYITLEDRFRGSPEVIAEQQRSYLELLDGIVDDEHPLLDLGSGRGEWLQLLHDAGLPASGVDANPVAVAECVEAGLRVVEGDLAEVLASTPGGSLGAITMFQVVEHLPFPVLLRVVADAAKALRPGGLLIAETPNATNLQVAATNFWLDPTHERPLHPELLRLIAKESGFARIDGRFLHRLAPAADLSAVDDAARPELQRLLELLDGPGDFALLAWTPAN